MQAGELSKNRGKLSVLLINDIDAGLGAAGVLWHAARW